MRANKQKIIEPDRWMNWDQAGCWREGLAEQLLAGERGIMVGVRGIPDGRVASSLAAVHLLRNAESGITNVEHLRAACAKIRGEAPDVVMQLAERLNTKLCWRGFNADGVYEAVFNPRWDDVSGTLGEVPRTDTMGADQLLARQMLSCDACCRRI